MLATIFRQIVPLPLRITAPLVSVCAPLDKPGALLKECALPFLLAVPPMTTAVTV